MSVVFELNQMCIFQFLCKGFVEPDNRVSQNQSEYQWNNQENSQFSKFAPIGHFVHTTNAFTHSSHAVRERKQRINLLEKCRRGFNRESASAAGNLHNKQDYADCLSDIPEGNGQCIDDIHIDDTAEPSCQ